MSELLIQLDFKPSELIAAANKLSKLPGFVWFDSTEGYKQAFSFMTWNPLVELKTGSSSIRQKHDHFQFEHKIEASSLNDITKNTCQRFEQTSQYPGFCGGWVALTSYDQELQQEHVHSRHSTEVSYYNFYSFALILDHDHNQVFLTMPLVLAGSKNSPQQIIKTVADCSKAQKKEYKLKISPHQAELSRTEYISRTNQMLSEIKAGNIYQVNLSYRIRANYNGDIFLLYEELRHSNPAPYSAFANFPGITVLSCSPELLLQKLNNKLLTKPIKGTRPRGHDAWQDQLLEAELQDSLKENSELTMIVDLERNDFSKIAKPGSVQVRSLGQIEKYANVQHLVAEVEAEVLANHSPIQILEAISPGGSISGAPKQSAITLIDKYELSNRGFYTGSLGYISLNGDMSFNILIRSIFASNGSLYLGTGSGIVADSDPNLEYQETLDKAALLIQALKKFS
jgi:para-aminobenzoate synthetase component I